MLKLSADFRHVRIKINRSLLNRNYNGSVFGGTLFTATDPFYPVMFHQVFTLKGYKVVAWSKSAHIHFLKPATSDVFFDIDLLDTDITEAEKMIRQEGKYTAVFNIDIYNKDHEICVTVGNEVYIRDLNFIDKPAGKQIA